jgi:nitroreductase
MAWIEDAVEKKVPLAVNMNFHRLVQSWRQGSDPICRSAPHLAIAYVNKNDRMAAGDATIALTHLEHAAPAFGLAACWAGYFTVVAAQSEKVKELLSLPADHVVMGTMMFGVPATKYYGIPKRNFVSIEWK